MTSKHRVLTVLLCMQHELYLKDPALIGCARGWFLLAEGYRLNVALSLHAIQLVSTFP